MEKVLYLDIYQCKFLSDVCLVDVLVKKESPKDVLEAINNCNDLIYKRPQFSQNTAWRGVQTA